MSYGPLFRHRWRLGTNAPSRKPLVRLVGVGGAALMGLSVWTGAVGAPLWERLLRRLWAGRLHTLMEAYRRGTPD
jgi:hypothetical protein